ncbi:MAG: esterase-like activity of phytase family protein [Chromatiales bacterium]|nr:esterase-like activity of phytase family protein [Chromatiales bacterium]
MQTLSARLLSCLMLWCISLPVLSTKLVGTPMEISGFYGPGDQYQNIRLIGALNLSGSKKLAELSGLAWDEDEQLLYAISDQGRLLHLKPIFKHGRLFDMALLDSFRLRNSKGKKLKERAADAEGLNILNGNNGITGDSKLLISVERRHRILVTNTQGRQINTLPLPAPLDDKKAYAGKNYGIEGFVIHPILGPLYSAEKPLNNDQHLRLISERGDHWFLPTLEEGAGVVAMENSDDGGILVLERAVTTVIKPWTITLYKVFPTNSNRGELLTPEILARMNSGEDWYVQNIEGLTHYKDQGYFMVSDDGDSVWQQTQFIYVELLN